ncbi:DNA primase [Nocardioides yefusunii]|uniref:DNA primase n=1 Tax=Nocardioides yefusunii TaxID=2500546 RepID=A0ABW1QVW1_9ACTN|nr:DNA primase [Nocardioides yefusunii]
MVGRIRDEDIAEVREKARIDEVVSEYVTLRRAGGGSMKGLCPFHDERSPSFHVTPSRGFFHCFGCQEGGDAISFLMKIDGLSFSESVEHLADKFGVQVRREEGDEPQRPRGPQRSRLVDAHKIAQEFYSDQLLTPDALTARKFLSDRGFDQDAAETFGIGFAPRDGDALHRLLTQKGFSVEEMTVSGLVAQGRSLYDRFRGRLLWPIRESNGDTVGFGARRIFDDDRIEAKYLNTSETPIYKKSQVLYGLDLARRDIAKSSRAVIVEGYTDVMACHLAGVPQAVATCGTAFGDDHARVLRRFLGDDKKFHGEVIFAFDGDAAGQKAALRTFQGDQNFVSQTYVAVEASGMDPCDLRIQQGDAAVRELIDSRQPLYRFVLSNVVSKHDLDRADGRVDALREAARLVSSVRDRSKVDAFARELASLVGVDPEDALTQVRRAEKWGAEDKGRTPSPEARRAERAAQAEQAAQPETPRRPPMPHLRDPRFAIERETLKLVLQYTHLVDRPADQVTPADFQHPVYRAVWETVLAAGGMLAAREDAYWVSKLPQTAPHPVVASAITELGVEPIRSAGEPTDTYVRSFLYRLLELSVDRRVGDLKSRLQRSDPSDPSGEHGRLFAELMTLEQRRRALRTKGFAQ